jgi:hypothetical protein
MRFGGHAHPSLSADALQITLQRLLQSEGGQRALRRPATDAPPTRAKLALTPEFGHPMIIIRCEDMRFWRCISGFAAITCSW